MTQQKINQYNRRCAKLLDWKKTWYANTPKFFSPKDAENMSNAISVREMKFHLDWNLIIEVVEAIQKIVIEDGDEFCIEFYKNILGKKTTPTTYVSIGGIEVENTDPKTAIVQAIDEFLIWYEQSKTT